MYIEKKAESRSEINAILVDREGEVQGWASRTLARQKGEVTMLVAESIPCKVVRRGHPANEAAANKI